MTKEEVYKQTLEYFSGDELKTNIWIDKYCLRDLDGNYLESTPDDMFKRLAEEFARIEANYPKGLKYNEIYDLLSEFSFIIPGGSILYGVGNNYSYSSLGNCFVIGDTTDSYGSILKIDEEQAQLMKRRGGVGHDLSHLRPRGSKVSNAANTSTGAVSFMNRYSNTTREVGQDGRRGALMLTMNINHPDAEEFITSKDDLTKLTGCNISVKITDDFMNKVKQGEVDATRVWGKIIHQAWKSAEPGVLFWDTVTNNSPADKYVGFESISTNPCGEIPLCPYDTCRLMSLNLYSFVENPFTSKAWFNAEKFEDVTYKAQRLMDDVIDLEEEKIDKILAKLNREGDRYSVEYNLWMKIKYKLIAGRRTGLSFIGLADTFAAMNIQYGSDSSIAFATEVAKLFKESAYRSSNQMAEERGDFPAGTIAEYNEMQQVFKRWTNPNIPRRRNIALLTIPPSGTISMLAGISSGIEPVFNLSYTRRRKVENSDNVAFIDKTGDKFEEYTVYHEKFAEWRKMNPEPFEGGEAPSPYNKATANEIDPMKRVELQAAIQKYIDHSISSTINLPSNVTEEEVSRIYMYAWELGCKGITIYREGCRDGILINKSDKKDTKFEQHDAPKRPKELECDVKYVKIKGEEYCILVGLLDNKPYEVFIYNIEDNIKPLSKKHRIIKEHSGCYTLWTIDDNNPYNFGPITENLTDDQKSITRLISTALRHGASIKFIVEQLNKIEGDMTSFTAAIARVLKKYISNGQQLKGSDCPNCGSKLVMENGCEICKSCGISKCG